jgi:nucleoside 2-deoxyribosyltransferase
MLQEKLASAPIPRTPKEKLDNLLLSVVKQQAEDGAQVTLYFDRTFKQLYFKSTNEFLFYIKSLSDDGLIIAHSDRQVSSVMLTHKGLLYAASLERSSLASSLCFVAMSFNDAVKHLYTEAIKPACEATGFETFRVDEYHPDAEQTINDAIIAGIKRSRFCIADFTQHRRGVYFEAGYALGRGLKVIYTCHSNEFKDSHFDTNHYPHIIYDTTEELREKLIAKIEAWVKD